MKALIEKQAIAELPGILANLLEIPESKVTVRRPKGKNVPDFILKAPGYELLAEFKSTSARAPLLMARQKISEFKKALKKYAIPLIVVPYMGKSGIDFCRDHNLSWIDLSGNVYMKAPGLLLHVEGRPNRFKSAGRPANVFAPKSSRIVRQLLIEPGKRYSQRELSQITGLDEGQTSRIVRRLESQGLIERDDRGGLSPSAPDQFLDAWHEVYDFSRHQIIKGHIAARTGEELLKRVSKSLYEKNINYAATGLGGAWQYTHFAKFRLATFYLAEPPQKNLFDLLHFREDDSGANTWLVIPNDQGVFHGTSTKDNIICVHPVQIYLDLKGHPERAKEAAAMLRKDILKWRQNA